jgi:hypothetical protein
MRRHVLIGRLGNDDRERVLAAPDEVATNIQLVAGRTQLDYGIGRAITDLARLGAIPNEIGVDLLILAALVYAADTRISRDTESQDSWTRELRLVVPVSDPAVWRAAESTLQQMLNFLTGDHWIIGFRARPNRFASIVPRRASTTLFPAFDSLALFSGGLDSLIGAIDLLESGRAPLFVSHAAEGATSDAQSTLFEALKKHYKSSSFERIRLWMNFPKDLIRGVAGEDTTRGRSFLFFSAGVLAGTTLSTPFELRVPENGFIALNVPLDPLRLGALSTRTTHPFYIARWNDLLGALGLRGVVVNPYWDKTKGDMVRGCTNQKFLRAIVKSSLSCSSPTKGRWKGRAIEHCGYCLPCIIRRASLVAGLRDDPTPYTLEALKGAVLDSSQAEGRQVRSFQYAIERLRKNPSIATVLIHKPGSLSDETPARQAALADVYRRGLLEVAAILDGVDTRAG